MNRRSFLKLAGIGAASSALTSAPIMRALADTASQKDDAFIVIHAVGGWDVTLWADPRNAARGLVDPATDQYVTTAGVKHWVPKSLGGGISTFEMVNRNGFALGPAMGDLAERFDRCTIINGIAMDTVSHYDGRFYSVTGRHLAGGRPLQTSVDTLLAGEIGPGDLLPLVSVGFPSTFLSPTLDARAMPLRVDAVTAVGKSMRRSQLYTTDDDRTAVTALLADEAAELAAISYDPQPADRMKLQYEALAKMLANKSVLEVFDESALKTKLQPRFFADASGVAIERQFHDKVALNLAFAVEAIKKRMVRCVSFGVGGFDTHGDEYEQAPLAYQEVFDLLALLLDRLDAEGMSNRVHVLVLSDFCRTPQINIRGGRDHYPNNSALILSPRFKGKTVFGATDIDQLLPQNVLSTALGKRPVRPGDVLATFLSAVGIDPRAHLRDGDVLQQVLA